jgi:hypothetical protein
LVSAGAAGLVVVPFDLNLSLGKGFYLYYPQSQGQRKDIVVLRDWLLQAVFEHEE